MAFKVISDRLYSQIPVPPEDLRLYQTAELSRLRQVSLSAIPTWIIPCGICANKFEHSVGVMRLANIVVKQGGFEEESTNIRFAALSHDIGTPPFSHLSEYFLKTLHGKDHEQFSEDILLNSELSEEMIKQGGDISTIIEFITGMRKPFSDIINGSIDVDNLDNSLRYCISMGLIDHRIYSPENIASCYRISDSKQIYLDAEVLAELPGWEECRLRAYNFIYSERNRAPGSMIFRAIDLASRRGIDEIPPEFFRMTDYEAYSWLQNKCNQATKNLVNSASNFKTYELVFSQFLTTENPELSSLIKTSQSRELLADEIADELGVQKELISVFHGKNKGYKQIHIPILDSSGAEQPKHPTILSDSWNIQVFMSPNHVTSETKSAITSFLRKKMPTLEI